MFCFGGEDRQGLEVGGRDHWRSLVPTTPGHTRWEMQRKRDSQLRSSLQAGERALQAHLIIWRSCVFIHGEPCDMIKSVPLIYWTPFDGQEENKQSGYDRSNRSYDCITSFLSRLLIFTFITFMKIIFILQLVFGLEHTGLLLNLCWVKQEQKTYRNL